MKQTLCGSQIPWADFFNLFKNAFLKDDMFIHSDEKSLSLTLWCQYKEKQISFNVDLVRPEGDLSNSEEFSLFIFSMVDLLRSQSDKPEMTGSSLSMVSGTLQSSLSDLMANHITVGDIRSSGHQNHLKNQKNLLNKRKGVGFINPTIKRRKPQPTKIAQLNL